MKKLLAAFLLSALCCCLHAQTITGRVYRGNSDTTVANAVVYYSGSMNGGTITHKDGRFAMVARAVQIPIVVSCVGYFSNTVSYQPGQPLIVRLKPRSELLQEVVIRADGMKREDEIAMFKKGFLGISDYARSCTITNIDAVNLYYNKKNRALTATCPEPIIIVNKKLGYTISYYLDNFEDNPKEISFSGTYFFNDDVLEADKDFKSIQRNREDAYSGSRMQFVRALWNHTLDKSGFRVFTRFFDLLGEDDMVVKDSTGQKFLKLQGNVTIVNADLYKNNQLAQKELLTFIDKNGYYGTGLVWTGILGDQRLGDLLPFEYQSRREMEHITSRIKPETLLKNKTVNESATFADNIPDTKDLTPAQKKVMIFKNMVLTQANPIDTVKIVKRWQRPIFYRVYGTTGSKGHDAVIANNLSDLFRSMSAHSKFPMQEATADSAVNLQILIGKPSDFKQMLSPDALTFFQKDSTRTGYYTYSDNGFESMVQLVNTGNSLDNISIADRSLLWPQIRIQLLVGLGFFGQLGYDKDNRRSIFNRDVYQFPNKVFQPLDQYLIRSLYHPAVKSNMQATDLDEAIKTMNL